MTRAHPIVSAVNIGKSFSRRRRQNISRGVGDVLRNIACLPAAHSRDDEEFWAVERVSLDIFPGDAIGVIGRNGGGKTTLMRLLSGLLAPTRGSVAIHGEIQALINLGAGFNQRLSGRENVVNGIAMRNIPAANRAALLDRIVDFSEIGSFIDGPVETYSSGMRSRLGFALCAFLEPDLIVIDEALSVGDLAFQNKCKLQLQAMKQKGVAMLLVSHSMTSIKQFCDRAIWMHEGKVRADGAADDVAADYLQYVDEETRRASSAAPAAAQATCQTEPAPARPKATAGKARRYENLRGGVSVESSPPALALSGAWRRPAITPTLVDELYGGYVETGAVANFDVALVVDGAAADRARVNGAFSIEYSFDLARAVTDLNVSLVFHTQDGKRLSTISTLNGNLLRGIRNGHVICRVDVPDMCLAPGQYVVTISVHEGSAYLWRDAVLAFGVSAERFMVWNQISMRYDYLVYDAVDE